MAANPFPTAAEEQKPKLFFECSGCGLHEEYHYYGCQPPFCRAITFREKSYVMRDPFSKGETANFLLLGSQCSLCHKMVCQDCSVFFTARVCTTCYSTHSNSLPEELRQIMKKQKERNE